MLWRILTSTGTRLPMPPSVSDRRANCSEVFPAKGTLLCWYTVLELGEKVVCEVRVCNHFYLSCRIPTRAVAGLSGFHT